MAFENMLHVRRLKLFQEWKVNSWPFLRDSERVAGVEMAAQLLVLEYNLLVAQLTSRGKDTCMSSPYFKLFSHLFRCQRPTKKSPIEKCSVAGADPFHSRLSDPDLTGIGTGLRYKSRMPEKHILKQFFSHLIILFVYYIQKLFSLWG